MRAVGARGPGDLGLTPTAAERRRENLFEPRHPDNRVGGKINKFFPDLSHHRAYRPVHGGSINLTSTAPFSVVVYH